MSKTCQSIYVMSYRWMFKNFGQGKLPRFKSMLNVSFLLIIVLTTVLLLAQFVLRSGLFTVDGYITTAIMLGALFFVFLNHLIFLNNRWVTKLNQRMGVLSKRNLTTWPVVVLINVILICTLLLFTVH